MGRLALLSLGLWLVGALALGALLLAPHSPLPVPAASDEHMRAAFDALLHKLTGWRAIHVMYRACACSQRTIHHLRSSVRPVGVREVVLMVDDQEASDPDDEELRRRGFEVVVTSREALSQRFGLEAAPVLVVLRPDGSLAYLGGYTRSKQGPVFQDVQIIAGLLAAVPSSTLPVFGCATSARLANTLDPLGLSRW